MWSPMENPYGPLMDPQAQYIMCEPEFLTLCEDAKLIKADQNITVRRLQTIFTNVQQDEEYGNDDAEAALVTLIITLLSLVILITLITLKSPK